MAFERITQKDWYKILGAKPSDSLAELKRKYQKLALLYHPDKQKADVPAGEVEERVQRFIEIDQAWKILGNEETKKEYDLQQRGHSIKEETTNLKPFRGLAQTLIQASGLEILQELPFFTPSLLKPIPNFEEYGGWKQMMVFGDKEGNIPLSDQLKAGDAQFFWGITGGEDNLTKEWPLHAQICLEEMSWNEDEQCYTLSCRCGGNYTVFKSETKDVSLVCCDTCSLVIEILQ